MFEVICFKETTTQCSGKPITIHAWQLGKKKIGPSSFAIINFFGAINLYKKFDEHQQQFLEDLVIYTYKVYKFFSSCENIWLWRLLLSQHLCVVFPSWSSFVKGMLLAIVKKNMDWHVTVVSRLSTHSFKYASQLSTHFLAKHLGFKIY